MKKKILYQNQFTHAVSSSMKHIQSTYLQDILLMVTTSSSTVYTVFKSLQDCVSTVQYTNADVYILVKKKKKKCIHVHVACVLL